MQIEGSHTGVIIAVVAFLRARTILDLHESSTKRLDYLPMKIMQARPEGVGP